MMSLRLAWRRMAIVLLLFSGTGMAQTLDLTRAVVIAPTDDEVAGTAQRVLVEEIAKRTELHLSTATKYGERAVPAILLCTPRSVPTELQNFVAEMGLPNGDESFAIATYVEGKSPVAIVLGNNGSGVLFGVGRLLLQLHMDKRQVELAAVHGARNSGGRGMAHQVWPRGVTSPGGQALVQINEYGRA